MKKKFLYSIVITLLVIVAAVAGTTYAYYSLSAAGTNRNVSSKSEKYEVIYNEGTYINSETCEMDVVASKEEGCYTDIEIGLANGVNVAVNANLYINVVSISPELQTAGFKWEVYRLNGNTETYLTNGNFQTIPANNQIVILTNESLSTTKKKFRIYIWLDGNLTDNTVVGKSFNGYVGANTEILTGIINNS